MKLKRGTPSDALLLKSAIASAQASGRILMKYYGAKLSIREKSAQLGLVTNADIEAEEAAVQELRRATPSFGFLTEEAAPEGERLGASGRWIIDPLDGTTNFVHRFPMFCVSIAAEWEGELRVGVVLHPVLGEMYVATHRGGARLISGSKSSALHVSRTRKLYDSLLTTGFSYRKDEILHKEMAAFEKLSLVSRALRRPGSAALDLAYTARGVFDGFWERRLAPWDVAAGVLLVREAGGRVTDFTGKDFRIGSKELLASNRALHPALLAEVRTK